MADMTTDQLIERLGSNEFASSCQVMQFLLDHVGSDLILALAEMYADELVMDDCCCAKEVRVRIMLELKLGDMCDMCYMRQVVCERFFCHPRRDQEIKEMQVAELERQFRHA